MKKILLSTLLLFISVCFLPSCVVLRKPVAYSTTFVDYSKYSDEGFFITESNSVNFNYTPLSSLYSVFMSGYEVAEQSKLSKNTDDLYYGENVKTTSRYIQATPQKAIEEIYKKAKGIGANGIINLNFRSISNYDKSGVTTIVGYEASGMAIRK